MTEFVCDIAVHRYTVYCTGSYRIFVIDVCINTSIHFMENLVLYFLMFGLQLISSRKFSIK
jgi:hypothetical protein